MEFRGKTKGPGKGEGTNVKKIRGVGLERVSFSVLARPDHYEEIKRRTLASRTKLIPHLEGFRESRGEKKGQGRGEGLRGAIG